MSLKTPKAAVFRKWAEIHCSRWRRSSTSRWFSRVTKVGTKELMHGLVKQTQLCVSFKCSVVTKRELTNTAKFSVFKWVFGVEPAELSKIAFDRERYFGSSYRAAGPATLPKRKAGTKMSEWICRITLNLLIYEIVLLPKVNVVFT